ncbi:glycoside hydrolase family 20 zincin-like fold domain-containing protein [Mariniphaga sp.]|uniref:glycoside hydrolase family 20 zincin-like fold domain-containing protein n=1 Tax=Mariniphaga sp. TaxID=1954475 RepID=UPI003566A230
MSFKKHFLYPINLAAILFLLFSFSEKTPTVRLELHSEMPQVIYAAEKIKTLQKTNAIVFDESNADLTIQTRLDSVNLVKEAYRITVNNDIVEVTGGDAVGLMYGLLEVKNQLKAGKTTIESKEESPNLSFRAIKFNLPWDSYRRSPALQLHYETCRDTNYWKSFLDMMVENRFNKLTLWNLHPFSYMVKTEKYPDGCSVSDEDLPQWQKFWRTLFRMAKNRGIETYLVNWNIFVSPEFAKAHNVCDYCLEGKHYVPQGDTSAITKDFYRESIKAVIDTYPDLTGLGITLGEGMGNMTAEERQNWILENYIGGVRMASRKIKFIYRVPLSAGTSSGGATSVETEQLTRSALDTLTCFDGPINIELKFNWSHAFSTPTLVKVHGGKLNDVYWNPMPTSYSLSWMMRNEDFFMLRWGQPDFFRKHIATNVKPHVSGYYVGSETYIPAKDYITSLPGSSYKYAFERQWMFYKVMGRLMYNPNTPDEFFANEFEQRFPKQGEKLFEAQTKVSKVPLVIASWQNATWDFSLYSEGMLRSVVNDNIKVQKLISLDDMALKKPMEPAYLSIADFLANEKNIPNGKFSPLHLADSVEALCNQALNDVKRINPGKKVDLLYEVSDVKAWANLGFYFSNKLRAAVEYKRYKTSNEKKDLENAIEWLTKATKNWHSLIEITTPVYQPVPLTHFCENSPGYEEELFHWSIVEKEVKTELEWLQSINK